MTATVIALAESTGQAECRRLPSPDELVEYPTDAAVEAVHCIVKWYLEADGKERPVEPVTLEQIGALAVFALDARALAATLAQQADEILSSLVQLDEARMSHEREAQP